MTEHAHHENRLAGETSPYLLQHKKNPVNWYPWGDEAFEKARRENKPLLISIGYSACHWCHVMERESFESEEIARVMNEMLVPVKVDREEHPDVDAIYMNACIAMSGQGGWPLNAFVTPDLKPFFVGTYFPPDGRWGRPGFKEVLQRIRELWLSEGEQIKQQAAMLQKQLEEFMETARPGSLDQRVWDRLVNEAAATFDIRFGGFGGAPKFPPDQRVAALLVADYSLDSRAGREMATKTLDKMAYGGMYDQLGGGFARYSVDEHWLIPHFEKMLYNQALLVPVYLDAFVITEKPLYERVARETLDWVLRDLTSSEGVFYSALDADSEGEEGKYYVWTPAEVESILGKEDAALFSEYYGVTKHGNFEHGTSALHIETPPDEFAKKHGITEDAWLSGLDGMKRKMLEVRAKRVPPGLDDKALTSWNGLMITSMCRGFQVTGVQKYLSAARAAADFILEKQRRGDTLLRSYCKGQSRIPGVLDDYAFFIGGLLDLYESCFEAKYLTAAAELAETMIRNFYDEADGGFFFTTGEDKSLISRTKDLRDGALPAGSSVAVTDLLRLAAFFDRTQFREVAAKSIEAVGARVNQAPSAFASLLLASRYLDPAVPQIVFAGNPADATTKQLIQTAYSTYLPARVIGFASPDSDLPLLEGKSAAAATAYVCENYTCKAPVHMADELQGHLAALQKAKP